jgi:tRNA (guanine-N7-)-methyltransferase
LRRHHSQLMEEVLPRVSLDVGDPLNGLVAPLWLEIGFGGGEHLAHQAALNPDVTIIGAEAFLNGVAKILSEIDARALTNVRLHYGDARPLLEALPAAVFNRIFLLYPDPWPKERHKKRRFINPVNLDHFHRLLTPDGQFLFASDIPDYVDWTREHVAEHKGFVEDGDPTQPYENWIRTRFEAKAFREGRTPAYLTFRKQ